MPVQSDFDNGPVNLNCSCDGGQFYRIQRSSSGNSNGIESWTPQGVLGPRVIVDFDPDDASSWEPNGHDFGRAGTSANPAAIYGVEFGIVTGTF